jgi:hypothetical protein
MNRIFAFGLSLAFGASLHAQTIHVLGKVSNGSGQPLANAVVELVQQGVKDTTGADGLYSLAKPGVPIRPAFATLAESMRLSEGVLELRVGTPSPLEIEVFDVNGTIRKKEFIPNAEPGVYHLDIAPLHSNGLRIVKASIGPLVQTFRYFPGPNAGSGERGAVLIARTSGGILAKTAAAVDTLKVSAAGHETKKIGLSSYDTTVNVILGTNSKVISYVDLSLNGSQRYVLRVDGKPFFPTAIQVRLDKLFYRSNWNATGWDAILAQLASDGFNTVSIPVMWYEIEPTKDKFDWTLLDQYLALCTKNNLKMEILWYSQNSGGHVQWLGYNSKPVHLRTPDYVLYSPSPSSNATTSEFKKTEAYTMDLADANLRTREAYVVSQMMAHIAEWDAANGSPHTVIGMQLGNEVGRFRGLTRQSFYSAVGDAVKNSNYSVWTRMNAIIPELADLLNTNEAARSRGGTGIDFVGVDLYGADIHPKGVRDTLKETGKNFRMIMEIAAEVPNVSQLSLTALSGGVAYHYYEACGTDGHGIYSQNGANMFKPRSDYITAIRATNHMLLSDVYDLALLKPQSTGNSGFFVHNWQGTSVSSTTGVRGVSFTPGSSGSQGISIARSATEIVLMNTLGGTFNYPASLQASAASRGYFDANNTWVPQGEVTYSSTSITPPAGSTVRLTVAASGP